MLFLVQAPVAEGEESGSAAVLDTREDDKDAAIPLAVLDETGDPDETAAELESPGSSPDDAAAELDSPLGPDEAEVGPKDPDSPGAPAPELTGPADPDEAAAGPEDPADATALLAEDTTVEP